MKTPFFDRKLGSLNLSQSKPILDVVLSVGY